MKVDILVTKGDKEQTKSIVNIKSKYILRIIFNNLEKKKLLDISKYNKNIKEKINININDYKEYSDLIEIEIKPINNKFGKFINIIEKDARYYHIYFNNNREEIKRDYIKEYEEIKIIKIIIDSQITSFEDLFYNCECIKSIHFK